MITAGHRSIPNPTRRTREPEAVGHRLVLFDGVPGSGKTTTSRAAANALEQSGKPCGWALEVDKAHPFFGPSVKKRHREPDYAELCLHQWDMVSHACRQQSWVLESCALQSTVRFMFEQGWDGKPIEAYWSDFGQRPADTDAALVYFRHGDVEAFIRGHTMHVRADVWAKISRHVESTPVGRQLAEHSRDVPVEFWVRYAELCDALVDRCNIPVLNINVEQGWEHVSDDVTRWLGTKHTTSG